MKRSGLALLLLCSMTSTAEAVNVYGYGNMSCGQWTEVRTAENRNADDPHALMMVAWMHGFLTAASIAYSNQNASLKTGDNAAFKSWIDNYCQSHPLDEFVDAVHKLVEALKVR
jgi:hypothetical protein